MASAGIESIADRRLLGLVTLRRIHGISKRVGDAMRRLRGAPPAAAPVRPQVDGST